MEKMGGWNGWRLFRQGIVSVKARLVLWSNPDLNPFKIISISQSQIKNPGLNFLSGFCHCKNQIQSIVFSWVDLGLYPGQILSSNESCYRIECRPELEGGECLGANRRAGASRHLLTPQPSLIIKNVEKYHKYNCLQQARWCPNQKLANINSTRSAGQKQIISKLIVEFFLAVCLLFNFKTNT